MDAAGLLTKRPVVDGESKVDEKVEQSHEDDACQLQPGVVQVRSHAEQARLEVLEALAARHGRDGGALDVQREDEQACAHEERLGPHGQEQVAEDDVCDHDIAVGDDPGRAGNRDGTAKR